MSPYDNLDARNLKLYLEEIAKYPMLTEEEEKSLGEKVRRGDGEALNRLVEANLRFVVSYAKKYRGMGLGLSDLINEGNLGLIEAARRFDPGRNVRFISYAVWWIRQAIIHALSLSSHIYTIPQKISDRISRMKRKRAQLKSELGREPRRDEIAAGMNLSNEEIAELELLEERKISISEKFFEEDMNIEERLSDPSAPSVEDQLVRSSVDREIRDLLGDLEEKEANVLRLRFGLDDDKPRTLQEIGAAMGLTRERIRQIEQKAMRKLGQSRKIRQLRGHLN